MYEFLVHEEFEGGGCWEEGFPLFDANSVEFVRNSESPVCQPSRTVLAKNPHQVKGRYRHLKCTRSD